MATVEGFEPPNAGIKIQCLNQLGDTAMKRSSFRAVSGLSRRHILSEGRQSIECLRVNEGVRVFPRRQTVFPVGQKKNEREVVNCMNGGRYRNRTYVSR